jgi:hypothetical protein
MIIQLSQLAIEVSLMFGFEKQYHQFKQCEDTSDLPHSLHDGLGRLSLEGRQFIFKCKSYYRCIGLFIGH